MSNKKMGCKNRQGPIFYVEPWKSFLTDSVNLHATSKEKMENMWLELTMWLLINQKKSMKVFTGDLEL